MVTHRELETPPAPPSAPVRRRRLIGGALLLVVLALIAETLWFAPFVGDTAPTERAPTPVPLAAVNPYGANVFLNKEVDPWKKEKTLQMAQEAGIGWIKQEFPWAELEFKKGVYWDDRNAKSSWAKFDEIVSLAQRYGTRVIARLDRPPDWARKPGSNPEAPPANLADFGDFVYDFVSHYKGQVQFLQIWNEPNLEREWYAGQTVDPAAYVALLKEAGRRAHEADPNVVILAAPLATTNENPPVYKNMSETRYLEAMYQAGAREYFDIMAANAYGLDRPPEDPPDPQTLNFRRVELLHQVMAQHGDTNKAIWFNEYGWNAPDDALVPNPMGGSAPNAARRWGSVSLTQQADYTVRGIQYAREHWPWAGVFTIWYFRQVGDIPINKDEYYFQMVNPDWVKQPIYNSVQAAAQNLYLAGPGHYGALEAPVVTGSGWSTRRDPQTGAFALVATVPSDTLRLRFQGTDLAVTVSAPASGGGDPGTGPPRLLVTVDGGTARVAATLPRDEHGRPYIDGQTAAAGQRGPGASAASATTLRQDDGTSGPLVPVVVGLGNDRPSGIHTVEFTPEGANLTFAGFVVRSERSYFPFAATTAALLLIMGLLVALLRRGRAATAR